MVDSKQFDSFLKETFTGIKAHEPAGLIVDLRNNGGGDSRLGNQLLSYLTDAPYVMSGGKGLEDERAV
jgi:C-terminal processing protease CtpA/Prc